MARWIEQTFRVNEEAEITLFEDSVWIGCPIENDGGGASFKPTTKSDAMAMALSLRLASKRLEKMAEGLP
jgi:hypothetical protein